MHKLPILEVSLIEGERKTWEYVNILHSLTERVRGNSQMKCHLVFVRNKYNSVWVYL